MTKLEAEQQAMRERWQTTATESTPKSKLHCVYLISSPEHGWSKIGMSLAATRRLQDFSNMPFVVQLQAFIPTFENVTLALLVEKKVHDVFADRRIRGEWFSTVLPEEFSEKAESVVAFIKSKDWAKSDEGQDFKFGADKKKEAFFSVCNL